MTLEAFVELFEPADLHVAQRLTTLAKDEDPSVALAVALAVRALRGGSVCVDLRSVADQTGVPDLPWPAPDQWLATVQASPLAAEKVLRVQGDLLYLDRYWREEQQVCDDILALLSAPPRPVVPAAERLFPAGWEEQRAAAEVALRQSLTVLTGGPGTGKTTTVARLLAAIADQADGAPPRMALAAPTGKAAARLQDAVAAEVGRLDAVDQARLAGLTATTLHRLLGSLPDTSSRFRHHRGNRLPHDVIVVDETSMVSLTMMARLLEAVRPDVRLLFVGDPDQLASVDAGAVLADLVDGLGDPGVVELRTSHRFGETIGALAQAIRSGDADATVDLLREGGDAVAWLDTDDPAEELRPALVARAAELREAALLGDAASALAVLDGHRLLCAHRSGPYGVAHWNRRIERWLADKTGQAMWSQWYPGRPLLVTANDYGLGVYNGDTGVVVAARDGLRAHIGSARGSLQFAPGRLGEVETMFAMTIHKSQGSQADEVTVLMPPEDSRLLTRELFYTAVTRAKKRIQVVGTEASVRAAVGHRAVRASGLARRLRDHGKVTITAG
ncbi:exodeoxyribonuclease V subunit alpha [Mycobacterium sp. 236(2023)]|uniref:exodeoxyribonuclease V subunit alpha n=1 Tax=Mycobacterium sp. 236(2023) TaxID=3038163 RepID=UPI0024154CCF|nr:exodeoxyribonuclease V subunit alpha [Mycobacterium sp. 236(2023)]MDG4663851.1 exodeoxyribonuclease V subunit alpha [Mycobacterium sp. 236(2023)]